MRSSIFLFGAMRPTNRKFTSSSSSSRSSAGRSPRRVILERADVALELVVHGERVQIGLVADLAQQIAHAARAVADGIAAMRRRNPLVDDHRNLQFGIEN